jgi:Holliday junction resolvase-like predicted endonuclease
MTAPKCWRPKLNNQQVGYAGENFVAAEIHRRGGYAVTFSGNMKGIDLLASDTEHKRIISIQVKTKTAGTWQTSIKHGKKQTKPDAVTQFWIFVDLGPEQPGYYVVPGWWIENDIDKEHKKYLKAHGGHRAKTDASVHHAIPVKRIAEWKDRWEILEILPKPPG